MYLNNSLTSSEAVRLSYSAGLYAPGILTGYFPSSSPLNSYEFSFSSLFYNFYSSYLFY